MNPVKIANHETNAILFTNTQNHHRIRIRNAKSNEQKNGKTRI